MKNFNWKYWIKVFGLLICIVTFIALAIVIYLNHLEPLKVDVWMRDLCYDIRGKKYGFGYWFFRIVTEFGNLYVIVCIVIATIILTKCDYRAIILSIGMLTAVLLNVGLKELYLRERPIAEMRWMAEDSTSFPSGHSTAVGFLYPFIIYLIYHTNMKKAYKYTLYTLCGGLIPIVMLSRLILGVHYFTDVLAGVSVGIMVSCFCMLMYKLCEKYDFMTEGLFDKIRKSKNKNDNESL